jgi:hypothetical protein
VDREGRRSELRPYRLGMIDGEGKG